MVPANFQWISYSPVTNVKLDAIVRNEAFELQIRPAWTLRCTTAATAGKAESTVSASTATIKINGTWVSILLFTNRVWTPRLWLALVVTFFVVLQWYMFDRSWRTQGFPTTAANSNEKGHKSQHYAGHSNVDPSIATTIEKSIPVAGTRIATFTNDGKNCGCWHEVCRWIPHQI